MAPNWFTSPGCCSWTMNCLGRKNCSYPVDLTWTLWRPHKSRPREQKARSHMEGEQSTRYGHTQSKSLNIMHSRGWENPLIKSKRIRKTRVCPWKICKLLLSPYRVQYLQSLRFVFPLYSWELVGGKIVLSSGHLSLASDPSLVCLSSSRLAFKPYQSHCSSLTNS